MTREGAATAIPGRRPPRAGEAVMRQRGERARFGKGEPPGERLDPLLADLVPRRRLLDPERVPEEVEGRRDGRRGGGQGRAPGEGEGNPVGEAMPDPVRGDLPAGGVAILVIHHPDFPRGPAVDPVDTAVKPGKGQGGGEGERLFDPG